MKLEPSVAYLFDLMVDQAQLSGTRCGVSRSLSLGRGTEPSEASKFAENTTGTGLITWM